MKKTIPLLLCTALLLFGCGRAEQPAKVAATTLPVYEFTARICQDTPVTVTRLVTEPVSCLHDYSMNVRQVQAAEASDVIVLSGAGLEEFMDDLLAGRNVIDASVGIDLLCGESSHGEEHHHEQEHHHASDPHIWLDPGNASAMARNICQGLCLQYPEYADTFQDNLEALETDLEALSLYGAQQLADLRCRELITFHDGFHYFAHAFDLTILDAVEEESGSEASAKELIHLIGLVREHTLPAVFTEKSGSASAASILSRETGCRTFSLDMAMAGESYLDAMYYNIDTVKEAMQ